MNSRTYKKKKNHPHSAVLHRRRERSNRILCSNIQTLQIVNNAQSSNQNTGQAKENNRKRINIQFQQISSHITAEKL